MSIRPTTTWSAPRDRLVADLAKARTQVRALVRALERHGIDTAGIIEPDTFRAEFEAAMDRIGPDPKASAHRHALWIAIQARAS
jgi:hypothetical protein